MKYQIWDVISYGYLEPLTPFTKLYESENLDDIRTFMDANEDKQLILTNKDGDIISNNYTKIYESPNGKEIYERTPLTTKRKQI